jgi:hypothetical protein
MKIKMVRLNNCQHMMKIIFLVNTENDKIELKN